MAYKNSCVVLGQFISIRQLEPPLSLSFFLVELLAEASVICHSFNSTIYYIYKETKKLIPTQMGDGFDSEKPEKPIRNNNNNNKTIRQGHSTV